MLTIKQEEFCMVYMETGNATEAYKKAYNTKNMKPATINRKAKELKDNGKITARIDELRAPILDKLNASEEKTIRRLMQGQEFDVRQLFHDDGRLKLPHELDENTAKAIVGVKIDQDGVFEYKVIDVKGCTEILCKYLGLLREQVDVTQLSYISEEPFDREKATIDWIRKTGATELILDSTTKH